VADFLTENEVKDPTSDSRRRSLNERSEWSDFSQRSDLLFIMKKMPLTIFI
jgi:hypothetical protein